MAPTLEIGKLWEATQSERPSATGRRGRRLHHSVGCIISMQHCIVIPMPRTVSDPYKAPVVFPAVVTSSRWRHNDFRPGWSS